MATSPVDGHLAGEALVGGGVQPWEEVALLAARVVQW